MHQADGDLIHAQNVTPDPAGLEGGIRKRGGMAKVNTNVLAGSIHGLISIPLPAPGGRQIFAGVVPNAGDTSFTELSVSTDGTTFAAFGLSFASVAYLTGQTSTARKMLQSNNLLFFVPPTGAAAGSRLYAVDKSSDFDHAPIGPIDEIVYLLGVHAGQIFLSRNGTVAYSGATILQIDPLTGEVEQFLPVIAASDIISATSFLGRIWIGSDVAGAGSGVLRSGRLGEAAWTTERTAAAGLRAYTDLVVFGGELYAATYAETGTAAIIEKRTIAGVWSTVRTGSVSADVNKFHAMVVHQGSLYAAYESNTGVCEIHRFDGSAWSIDKDLAADNGVLVSGHLSVGTSLYYGTLGGSNRGIWRKVGGVWSKIVTGSAGGGIMGVL